jgi:hypothetical protein
MIEDVVITIIPYIEDVRTLYSLSLVSKLWLKATLSEQLPCKRLKSADLKVLNQYTQDIKQKLKEFLSCRTTHFPFPIDKISSRTLQIPITSNFMNNGKKSIIIVRETRKIDCNRHLESYSYPNEVGSESRLNEAAHYDCSYIYQVTWDKSIEDLHIREMVRIINSKLDNTDQKINNWFRNVFEMPCCCIQ